MIRNKVTADGKTVRGFKREHGVPGYGDSEKS
jgi:hypothetical protein